MERTIPPYTLLDHTADLAIEVTGDTPEHLYENAGKALMHLMLSGTPGGDAGTRTISVRGQDYADLMVRWLGELLYLFEGDHLIPTALAINSLRPSYLEARVETVTFDARRFEVHYEIKAVTYHKIDVFQKAGRWVARVIFDI
ncbi:MAG: archease [Deltaproteobacteria bacterium]|nr:archease [Deltaproteobacteria bacterium]